MIEFELPFPPSLNKYYRRVGNRTLISKRGRRYREMVIAIVAEIGAPPITGRVRMEIEYHPPDRHTRDKDNFQKALFDSLEKAGAYLNDNQIDDYPQKWFPPVKGGRCIVRLEEIK